MIRRISIGEIKATVYKNPGDSKHSKYVIEESDLKQYILTHSLDLTGRNVDLHEIVRILTDSESVSNELTDPL